MIGENSPVSLELIKENLRLCFVRYLNIIIFQSDSLIKITMEFSRYFKVA